MVLTNRMTRKIVYALFSRNLMQSSFIFNGEKPFSPLTFRFVFKNNTLQFTVVTCTSLWHLDVSHKVV